MEDAIAVDADMHPHESIEQLARPAAFELLHDKFLSDIIKGGMLGQ